MAKFNPIQKGNESFQPCYLQITKREIAEKRNPSCPGCYKLPMRSEHNINNELKNMSWKARKLDVTDEYVYPLPVVCLCIVEKINANWKI